MEHVIPKTTLVRVGLALLALLGLTAGLAYLDLGPFGLVLALLVAAMKAALVLWFFMELRISERVNWIFAAAGLFWLLVLLVGTYSDYLTRADVFFGAR